MENIPLPKNIEYKEIKKNKTQIIIGPLFPGYGITIANSLRRVLLSSLNGAAITKVKIKGASHEFSTLDHLKEDVVEIMLNIKKIRLKVFSDEPIKLKLKVKGEKIVKAGDINKNAQIEIANPDLILAHLTDKKGELEIEFTADNGQGYVTVENKIDQALGSNEMSIDSFYSPIINVSFSIEDVRVGKRTDYEKLKMKVQTDGTIDPKEAISKATKILLDHFSLIYEEKKPATPIKKEKAKKAVRKVVKKVEKKPATPKKKTIKKEKAKKAVKKVAKKVAKKTTKKNN
jgi:DNA-directed RNA polymerase subunit alpha